MQLANQLSEGRKSAATKLSVQISAEMQRLSLSGGKFEIALTEQTVSANGLEQVEFLVAGHAGIVARPLGKVASGGELSRISLAIRVVTAQKESIPTMIFDEVDVGIGGGVAEVVGQLLKQLGEPQGKKNSAQRQVLVITHLPQVAALGTHHLRVSKSLVNEQTLSTIAVLDEDGREQEVARMLGGIEITDTTLQHAKEMLSR
jgi:DNA repair protein RecN (Recombination protein N)